MKKLIVMLFAILILTSYVSAKEKVSFKSEEGSLSIYNATAQDLVVFAGRVERNIILGGIKSGKKRSFNLGKLPSIPKNGALLVRIVPYKSYREKRIISEKDVVYTRLVVYDLMTKESKTSFVIPEKIDVEQKYCVYLTNTSDTLILQVRLGHPTQGEIIATLRPGVSNKRVFLLPSGDRMAYGLFPSFIYVHPRRMEVTTISSSREDRMMVFPEPVAGASQMVQFRAPSNYAVPYDVAFINLENNTPSSLEFRLAEKKILQNQKGQRLTASGRTDVYELFAGDNSKGLLYNELFFQFDDFTKKSVSPYSFKPGYEYKMTVTEMNGNYQYEIRELGQKSLVEDARIELYMEN